MKLGIFSKSVFTLNFNEVSINRSIGVTISSLRAVNFMLLISVFLHFIGFYSQGQGFYIDLTLHLGYIGTVRKKEFFEHIRTT